MSNFIQLHLLTSYGPSNLNRDDLGRPKTAKMGGVDRLRISSQSLKRAWRTSDLFQEALAEHIGTRTKLLGVEVFNRLVKKSVSEKKAKEWAQTIAAQFGKLKKPVENKPLEDIEIEQLVHVSPEEKEDIFTLIDTLANEDRAPEKEELNLLRKKNHAVDIALFGRMLASSPKYNVEAATQVAHAVTVNRIIVEDDYFTAVDDLNIGEEHSGSAHIGEAGFGSGVFYIYICINRDLLENNLDDGELTNKAIKALTTCAAKIAPSGKQNSYASRALASYILAEKGSLQPRQLSSAFLKPVDESDTINAAIDRLNGLVENMDKIYGKCADSRYSINVESGEGSFDELLNFVTE